jgi:hypothetical protein
MINRLYFFLIDLHSNFKNETIILQKRTIHTHTHTHIYIYIGNQIAIYIRTNAEARRERAKLKD